LLNHGYRATTPAAAMAQVQIQRPAPTQPVVGKPIPGALRTRFEPETRVPVNQNGSFEADRVLKSGYVQKRTQKTKVRMEASCLWNGRAMLI
jgi:hypothetical protein